MTTFDEREKGFESKFAHDQELEFKAVARRNKLFGLWAAERMGLSQDGADQYAQAVVRSDFEPPGSHAPGAGGGAGRGGAGGGRPREPAGSLAARRGRAVHRASASRPPGAAQREGETP